MELYVGSGVSGQVSPLPELGGAEDSDLLDFLLDDVFPVAGETDGFLGEGLEGFLLELLDSPQYLGSASPPASDSGISVASSPGSPNIVQTEHNYSIVPEELRSVRTDPGPAHIDVCVDFWDPDPSEPISVCVEEEGEELEEEEEELVQPLAVLHLSEEETRLLKKDGISLPRHLPLTRVEERALKRVRRKIRNKKSAQESRKKKREYLEGLESRVSRCSAHNQALQMKVQQLQEQNISLLQQLRNLRALVGRSGAKTTATGTCVMVLMLSFCLLLFPNLYPFRSNMGQQSYRGVVSRQLRNVVPDLPGGQISAPDDSAGEVLVGSPMEEAELPDLHLEPSLKGAQNDTPGLRDMATADSTPSVNSNSSSDGPKQSHPPGRPAPLSGPPELQPVLVDKSDWLEKSRSVIITRHHVDEM